MGLALPRESVGEVKERRKPDRRWQNREIGGGFPQTSRVAKASRLGSTCRGKALRIGKVVLFDEGRRKRSWFLVSTRGENSGRLRGATGSVRGRTSASRMVENAKPRWRRQKAVPGSALAERRTEPCTDRPKLEARRQARAQPGSDCRKAVRRRTEEPDPSRFRARGEGEASCGQRSASYAPGSRAVHGCSCRESVAEVGERHLLRAIEGSREANRGCTE